jgi:hypothetical protein
LRIKAVTEGLGKGVKTHSIGGKLVGDYIFLDIYATWMASYRLRRHTIYETRRRGAKQKFGGFKEL